MDNEALIERIALLERQLDDYRCLFQEAEVAMIILDESGKYLDINGAYYRMFGYSDKPNLVFHHPADYSAETQPDGIASREKANQMVQKALRQGKLGFDWLHKKLDGTEFLSYVILEAIRFNNQPAIRATICDVSEQRKLERLVEERTAELDLKNKKLAQLAITDPLTGLFNRIHLTEVLAQEKKRFHRYDKAFGVILLDIDNFKQVNDSCGHLVGDQLLIGVSNILKNNCRDVDTVGRWGGEEFLIIVPETNLDGVKLQAEKLRSQLAAACFSSALTITASFGVAAISLGESIEGLLGRADRALYKAKNMGRNAVAESS